VFDRNATGSLAPFNGMMVIGTHEEDPEYSGGYFYIMGVGKWDPFTI